MSYDVRRDNKDRKLLNSENQRHALYHRGHQNSLLCTHDSHDTNAGTPIVVIWPMHG